MTEPQTPPKEETYSISQSAAQAILNYLVSQPYNEVWQLIELLKSLKPIAPPADEEAEA